MSSIDARRVFVFLDDAHGSVTAEDVSDWLSMLGVLESIKLQFDATTKRPCYAVVFRGAPAAQQAVQYLDGVKLKNCTVTVTSNVYRKIDTTPALTDTDGASVHSTRPAYPEVEALPHNHMMPADIRMDPILAGQLSLLDDEEAYPGHAALLSELLDLQKRVSVTLEQIDEVSKDLDEADQRLVSSVAAHEGVHNASCSSSDLANAHYRNGIGIPVGLCSALTLVTHITEAFGPIASCDCLLDAYRELYFLSLSFMMDFDSANFRNFVAPAEESPLQKARSSVYHRALKEYGWSTAD